MDQYTKVSERIHAYPYSSTVFVPENHENQYHVSEIRIASQKFQILSLMKKTEKTKTHCFFDFS